MEEEEPKNTTVATVWELIPSSAQKQENRKVSPVEMLVKRRNKHLSGRSVQSLTRSLLKPVTDLDITEFKRTLEEGGDPNGDPQTWGEWRPIYWAATSGNDSALSLLLADPRTNINVTDNNGYTALHHAVISACRKPDRDGCYQRCIDLLLQCPHVKVNVPDKKGYTPLGRAVYECNKKCIEDILKYSSTVRFHLDYTPVGRNATLRQIMLRTYPALQSILPQPLLEDPLSTDISKNLLASLQQGQYSTFCELLQTSTVNPWYGEPYHSSLLEIVCQMKNREEFVNHLLLNGASPNIKHRITGLPLLHATVESGCYNNLILLLQHKDTDLNIKDDENRTVLHCLAKVHYREESDKGKLEKCIQILLGNKSQNNNENPRININEQDTSGKTALHIAIQRENQDRILLLLTYGADVVVKHGTSMLSSISSWALEEILDECIEHNNEPLTSIDFKVTLKFDFLSNILEHISNMAHLRDLLRHPVISTYLSLKWKLIRLYLFLDLLLYSLFVLILTVYVLFRDELCNGNDSTQSKKVLLSERNYNSTEAPTMDSQICKFDENYDELMMILWYLLMVFIVILTLREIFQMIIYRLRYFCSPENWLELLIIITSFTSTSGTINHIDYLIHSSAIVMFLGWLELVILMGKLPLLSVQLEMLLTVSWTFLRFMAGYILLIVAFAFSFYILFRKSKESDGDDMFHNPYISLLKTIVMFSGEFDASGLTFDTAPYTSHIIFIIFIFLVAIVLLNLLNGLAVNDTEIIRKDAETLSLAARFKLINKIENFTNAFPVCFRSISQTMENLYSFYPNRKSSNQNFNVLQCALKKKKQKIIDKNSFENKTLDSIMESIFGIQKRQEELENKIMRKYDETQQMLTSILSRLAKNDNY